MADADTQPPIWRVALAFVLAPAAAAFLLACLMPAYNGLPNIADRIWRTFLIYLMFGGYPAALVLGLPAFFLLKRRLAPTPLNCALAGAAIAAIPWLLLGLLSSPDYAAINGRVTYEDGVITSWGLLNLGALIMQVAGLGSFAGLVFWVVAAFRFRRA